MERNTFLVFLLITNLTVIGLIIYSFLTSNFGDVLTVDACDDDRFSCKEKEECIKNTLTVKTQIGTKYEGRPANRGLQPGGNDSCGGAFGNPNCL